MRRLNLMEFHDQSWFPAFLRDYVTDGLETTLNLLDLYRPVAARLQRALQESNATRVVDLCSGAGGPWLRLANHLQQNSHVPVEIWLTDKYPNIVAEDASHAIPAQIHFCKEPVDATRIPPDLRGFRTIFNSFHHFRPKKLARFCKTR